MFDIELSASSFCARVMRGTASIAIDVACFAFSRSMMSLFLAGQRKEMSVAPGFNRSTSFTFSVGCWSSEPVMLWLAEAVGVATVPGSSFYGESERGRSTVRFAFCKTFETLGRAAERLVAMSR